MHTRELKRALFLAMMFSVALPAMADKPSWAGKGKHESEDRDAHRGGREEQPRGRHFDADKRVAVREYYEHRYEGRGKCPPGLAKKHNGCMPPGQARKWQMGQALPRDVVVYPVPHELEVRIGLPPAGYKYVRVASDILMVAVGTSIVADAITDLGKM